MEISSDFLLTSGILSSVWYVGINAIVPFLDSRYSIAHQTVSELSAVNAPTRKIWVPLAMPYVIFLAFFGWGLVKVADNSWIEASGWLILFYSSFNFYWPPMHTREVLAKGGGTVSDTLHLVWAAATVFLFMLIMVTAAIGMGPWFQAYTVISVLLLATFGFLTSLLAKNVSKNKPTPNIGIYERANISVFLIWIVVLAASMIART